MSEKPAIRLFKNFNNHLITLNFTRVNTEKAFNKKSISKRDVEQVYKGLFLDAVASFEMLIENLFIGLLAGQYLPGTKKVLPKVKFKKTTIARDIVINNRYFNWLPYENTTNRATDFFRSGFPFTAIIKDQRFSNEKFNAKMSKIHCARNVIAHKSKYAQSQFENQIKGSVPLPLSERKIAPYLRGLYRTSPDHTRYERFIIDMAKIAKSLCEY